MFPGRKEFGTAVNLEELVARSKEGHLSAQDVSQVVSALESGSGADTYRLLYVIGRAGFREHEDVVARFLDYTVDPQVVALSIHILCTQWGLGSGYRDRLEYFLGGVEWDIFDEARHAAISSSGEYLKSEGDCGLFGALLRIARDDESDLSRRFAVESLARALGEPHGQAVAPAEEGRHQWSELILERADQHYRVECGSQLSTD